MIVLLLDHNYSYCLPISIGLMMIQNQSLMFHKSALPAQSKTIKGFKENKK